MTLRMELRKKHEKEAKNGLFTNSYRKTDGNSIGMRKNL